MKTRTIKVYDYSELSDSAKENARQQQAAAIGYSWASEAMESIQGLARHFGGQMDDWEIDWFNCSQSFAHFDMPEMDREEIAALLGELGTYNPETLKGNGDCKLTGYCLDEDAIDGFRAAFMAGESDLRKLMDAAFDTWLKAAQADCEGEYSDEQFAENCEANGYGFYENGELA